MIEKMSEDLQSNNENKKTLKKMEDMLKGRTSHYFDVDQFLMGGDYFLEQNKIKQAKELLAIALEQHPLSSELMIQQAQVLAMQERYNDALSLIDEAENIDPNNKDLILVRAEIYSGSDEHQKAIDCYNQFINEAASDEFLDVIYNDLAWEYETINDYRNALEALKKALILNPKDDSLLFEIAYFYEVLEEQEESISYYKTYIDEHPYSYNAWYNLGNIYNDLELYEKAVEAFDFALVIKDDFASAYFNKGNAYFRLGKYKQAIECYIDTFEYEENQAITYSYIGESFEKLNQLDDAEKSYKVALEIDSKLIDALVGITIVKDKQEKTIEGLPYIEQVTKLYPNNFDGWYILGEVNEKLERYESARTCYEKAYEIAPDNTDVILTYSNFIAEQDSVQDAIHLIEPSTSIEVKYRLVAYYLMLEKHEEAVELFENCLQYKYDLHKKLLEYYPLLIEKPAFGALIEKYN